jgi:hypothetical protein
MVTHNAFQNLIISFAPGERVFTEGEVGTTMFIVQSGRVRLFRDSGGKSVDIAEMEKGDFFGEMSLLEATARNMSAEAIENVELIEINSTTFDRMIRSNIEIAVRMLRKLSGRLRSGGGPRLRSARAAQAAEGGDRARASGRTCPSAPAPAPAAVLAARDRPPPPPLRRRRSSPAPVPPAEPLATAPAARTAPQARARVGPRDRRSRGAGAPRPQQQHRSWIRGAAPGRADHRHAGARQPFRDAGPRVRGGSRDGRCRRYPRAGSGAAAGASHCSRPPRRRPVRRRARGRASSRRAVRPSSRSPRGRLFSAGTIP